MNNCFPCQFGIKLGDFKDEKVIFLCGDNGRVRARARVIAYDAVIEVAYETAEVPLPAAVWFLVQR